MSLLIILASGCNIKGDGKGVRDKAEERVQTCIKDCEGGKKEWDRKFICSNGVIMSICEANCRQMVP